MHTGVMTTPNDVDLEARLSRTSRLLLHILSTGSKCTKFLKTKVHSFGLIR